MSRLPIEAIFGDLSQALRETGLAVIQAPPGAGKTTGVPLHLLRDGLVGGRIVMLEPRRVAARAAADRLAQQLGEETGGQVGYRIRGDAKPGSRIEVVTEGILTRMIQSDPELPGVGCIIFDEFHERALQADLGLALTIELRGALRPDLQIIVMSATLDAAPVADLLGDAPVITASGRTYLVETIWAQKPWRSGPARRGAFERAMADLTLEALEHTTGGVLVFLPGQAEISRTLAALSGQVPPDTELLQLHGGLSLSNQRRVLSDAGGARKVVLSTSIAETSLTIPGIRVVVDGGLARRSRFDPASGMSRLITEKAARAEADQRQGRAGRVAPGWCYRLWTRAEHGAMPQFAPPGISTDDLAALALELAAWGVAAPDDLSFLTPPPAATYAEAQKLLRELDALDAENRITAHGRQLARLPVHPRLAHMLVRAGERGSGSLAADLAALVEARDIIRAPGGAPIDLGIRLKALRNPRNTEADTPFQIDRNALSAVKAEANRLRRLTPRSEDKQDPLSPAAVLSLAYPDRIALRRPGKDPRYLLSGGKGALVRSSDGLADAPCLVAADLDGDAREALIRRAIPGRMADIAELHTSLIREVETCEWSRRDRAVTASQRRTLGALVLEERRWKDAPADKLADAMITGIRDLGLQCLPWTGNARRFAGRVEWLRANGEPDLPDFSDDGLLTDLPNWLAPYLDGARRAGDLARINLTEALQARLSWEQSALLERLAPAAIKAPTGTALPIDYSGHAPSVSVRLQEMFGLTDHPAVGPTRIPLLVHLLSPARRPVQSTSDLPGFWENSYDDVRRVLRGRYPKHFWPEDPAQAQPTSRTKQRRT